MKIGLVCPYSWDVPGGVRSHVRDLARVLRSRGHDVGVLAPGEVSPPGDDGVHTVGRAVPVPYNGSVARLVFGPRVAARTKRWLQVGEFDLLHVHEPATPSLSLLALWASRSPVVATFHTANDRSRAMTSVAALLRPSLEKLAARIAVSEAARSTLVTHVGGEPVIIPNGVDYPAFANAKSRADWHGATPTVAFLGRADEPRKGASVALEAFAIVHDRLPQARLLIGGPASEPGGFVPRPLKSSVTMLGVLSDADRASLLKSADVFVAPNLSGEKLGIVVVEAMAAGAAIVASDIPAFRGVLGNGRAGRLVPVGDPNATASAMLELLGDDNKRAALGVRASMEAKVFDWSQIVVDIEAVYAAVVPQLPDR